MYKVSWQVFHFWIQQCTTDQLENLWTNNESTNWIFRSVFFFQTIFSHKSLENVTTLFPIFTTHIFQRWVLEPSTYFTQNRTCLTIHFHAGYLYHCFFAFCFTLNAGELELNHCSFYPEKSVVGISIWKKAYCGFATFF